MLDRPPPSTGLSKLSRGICRYEYESKEPLIQVIYDKKVKQIYKQEDFEKIS